MMSKENTYPTIRHLTFSQLYDATSNVISN